jgi:hypothetical protein
VLLGDRLGFLRCLGVADRDRLAIREAMNAYETDIVADGAFPGIERLGDCLGRLRCLGAAEIMLASTTAYGAGLFV